MIYLGLRYLSLKCGEYTSLSFSFFSSFSSLLELSQESPLHRHTAAAAVVVVGQCWNLSAKWENA